MQFYKKKKINSLVCLLIRSGKVKDDFKIKSFFNNPEYDFLLKKCKTNLVKLIDSIDKESNMYVLNTLLRVFVLFLEDNSVHILNDGIICSDFFRNFVLKENDIFFIKLNIFLFLIFFKKKKSSCSFKSIFKSVYGSLKSFNLKIKIIL
uniref:Uncharacterized protein n=1 Tax=Paravannella minima TaxID=1443144 RepID=A0A411K7K6_9EUKA|nr:hypothetical protein [Paravannella minima]QBC73423.1 hypothetical protein [Paravannella minima]